MAQRVCVVGSLNVDLVVAADRLPAPGETVLGGRFSVHDGGKGANQAVAAARAGAHVTMVEADHTGVAIIAVGPRGENQIVVAPGANATLVLDDADRELIRSAQALLTN